MAQSNENVLFLTAFGEPCNKPYMGAATNDRFKEVVGESLVIAPWTSATPLCGELLQTSLDALLQNDLNLVSAYPYSYVQSDETTNSIGEITYSGVDITDSWNNAAIMSGKVNVSETVSSDAVLGSLVPAYPFKQNAKWNYGLFGVKDGAPAWFDVNVESMVKSDPGTRVDYRSDSHIIEDTTQNIFSENLVSNSNTSLNAFYDGLQDNVVLCSGSFNAGDILDITYRSKCALVYSKDVDGTVNYFAADHTTDISSSATNDIVVFTTDDDGKTVILEDVCQFVPYVDTIEHAKTSNTSTDYDAFVVSCAGTLKFTKDVDDVTVAHAYRMLDGYSAKEVTCTRYDKSQKAWSADNLVVELTYRKAASVEAASKPYNFG